MFELLMYAKVFLVGGFICMLGQVLVITTKMTSARILVSFLLFGVGLQVIGVFDAMKEFAGSGVTVPIMGFGYSLARGVMEGLTEKGILGILSGGLEATAVGLSVAVTSAFIFALIFKSRTKK